MKNMATNAKIKEIEKKRQAAIAKGEAVRDDDAPPIDPSTVSEPEFQFNLTAYVKQRTLCCAAADYQYYDCAALLLCARKRRAATTTTTTTLLLRTH